MAVTGVCVFLFFAFSSFSFFHYILIILTLYSLFSWGKVRWGWFIWKSPQTKCYLQAHAMFQCLPAMVSLPIRQAGKLARLSDFHLPNNLSQGLKHMGLDIYTFLSLSKGLDGQSSSPTKSTHVKQLLANIRPGTPQAFCYSSRLSLPRMSVNSILQYVIFIGYQTAHVRSKSDENGATLKPTWHDQMLNSDITVCLFP